MRITDIARPLLETLGLKDPPGEPVTAGVDPGTVPGAAPPAGGPPPAQGAGGMPGPDPMGGEMPAGDPGQGQPMDAGAGPDDLGPAPSAKPVKREDVEAARNSKYVRDGGREAAKDAVTLIGMSKEELVDELNQTKAKIAEIELGTDAGLYDNPELELQRNRLAFIKALHNKA